MFHQQGWTSAKEGREKHTNFTSKNVIRGHKERESCESRDNHKYSWKSSEDLAISISVQELFRGFSLKVSAFGR